MEEETFNIDDDLFFTITRRALLALDNLCQTDQIEKPVKFQILLDLAIGAVAESQITERINLLEVFFDHQEFLLDNLYFEEGGEYGLYDVMSQVVCFRIIRLMEDYLDELNIPHESITPKTVEEDD